MDGTRRRGSRQQSYTLISSHPAHIHNPMGSLQRPLLASIAATRRSEESTGRMGATSRSRSIFSPQQAPLWYDVVVLLHSEAPFWYRAVTIQYYQASCGPYRIRYQPIRCTHRVVATRGCNDSSRGEFLCSGCMHQNVRDNSLNRGESLTFPAVPSKCCSTRYHLILSGTIRHYVVQWHQLFNTIATI